MKLKVCIVAIIITATVGNKLKAQSDTAFSFSLLEAQNYAIENYYMSQNAEKDIEAAEKKVWETTAIGLPQLSGGVDYTYTPEVPKASFPAVVAGLNVPNDPNYSVTGADVNMRPDPDEPIDPNQRYFIEYMDGPEFELGVKNNISYNLMLTQLLFSGEYIVGLQASKTYRQFTQESYEKTSIEIKEMVAGSYFAILILEENERLLEETVNNLTNIYADTKKSADVGLIETTEADQIAINVTRTQNQLNSVQRQIEFMYKMLKYQLGLEVDADVSLSENLDNVIDSQLLETSSLYIFNLEDHIDYKMLSTREKLDQLSLNREKSLYLPSVSGFYRYEDKVEKAALDFTMKHMVGVSLAVPIFNSGMKNARVGQAKIELEKSQLMKEQESQALMMIAEQSKFDYLNALETYNNELTNFELSKRILNNTTARFNQGMVTSMDLTIANNQYLESQLTISTAILELLNARITLDKAYSKL